MYNIPIVLSIHTRPRILKKQLEILKQINPKKVYLIIDPPNIKKENFLQKQIYFTRSLALLEQYKLPFIKIVNNDQNKGSFLSFYECIIKMCKLEKRFLVLENDSLPCLEYFSFVREMLNKFKHNKDFLFISGSSYQAHSSDNNYYFKTEFAYPMVAPAVISKNIISGFLDFKKNLEDIEANLYTFTPFIRKRALYLIKNFKNNTFSSVDIDTYGMLYSLKNKKFAIFPALNLVENCGFDTQARNINFNRAKSDKRLNFNYHEQCPRKEGKPLNQEYILKCYLEYARV